MATLISNLPLRELHRATTVRERRQSLLLATALTPFALIVHGFHPFTEDGGIYLAGAEKLLHPALFPSLSSFVLAPATHSAFAALVSAIARVVHLTSWTQLPTLILALHLLSIWATLLAASVLASRCWPSTEARAGAVILLACWLSLPVAGTSLLFMDPYLTARSFSTPCLIVALIGALDATALGAELSAATRLRGLLLLLAAVTVAAVLHPLMAGYALLAAVLAAACRIPGAVPRSAALGAIFTFALLTAAAIRTFAPPDTSAYTAVALTRGYWFLSTWRWYELIGVAAPAAILALYSFTPPEPRRSLEPHAVASARALPKAAALCAVLVTFVAILFAHQGSPSHLVAALQPMRGLQFTYLVMTLCLGATLGSRILRRNRIRWAVAIPLLALPLFAASRANTPHTRHIELPALDSGNDWVRAFLWIRTHTPADALFALPPDYIGLPGEDAQCFRAISQRSALPDYSKDGGEAAVAPTLTPLWTIGQAAQSTLATDPDSFRRAKLMPLGVSWLVLPASAATALDCPYANAAAKVCRLR